MATVSWKHKAGREEGRENYEYVWADELARTGPCAFLCATNTTTLKSHGQAKSGGLVVVAWLAGWHGWADVFLFHTFGLAYNTAGCRSLIIIMRIYDYCEEFA